MATESFYISVGERVRIQRKNAGMDQETFSRHLGLSRTTIINIEKGRQRLSLEQAWLTAQVLEIPIEDLLPKVQKKSANDWEKELAKAEITAKQKEIILKFFETTKK